VSVDAGLQGDGLSPDTAACSDHIGGILIGIPPDPMEIQDRVRNSRAARKFTDIESSDFPEADLAHALMIDRFDFAMEVERQGDLLVLRSTG
jgi:hypothetical protein